MFSKLAKSPTIRKSIFNSTKRYNSEAATVSISDKDSHDVDTKPTGWDEARPFEAIPGPKPIPVFGNVWRFFPYIGNYHNLSTVQFYKSLQDTYGNVVLLSGLGRKPSVLLFDTNDMETAFRNAGPYPIRHILESVVYYRTKISTELYKGFGGLLLVQGEEWFKYRSLVNPILMRPAVAKKYVNAMDLVANDLIDNMDHFSKQNDNNEMPEDFINQLYNWGLESVAVVALNKRLGCLNLDLQNKDSTTQKFVESVVQSLELLYYIEVQPPVWKVISTPTWKKFVAYTDFIAETSVKYIEEDMARTVDENVPEHELSVVQRLAKIDKRFAVVMAMDMLGAGVDTTGRTLGAAIYFLAKNPDKQEKLRQEVLKNLPEKTSPVTSQVLDNSPYLKAVIKETTRLAPIGAANMRTTIKDLVLGGYRVPKDTQLLSMNLISSHSQQFKESHKFIPERYLRSTEDEYSFKNAHPFAALPFGHGSRSCVGKRLANLELEVAVSKIIRNFELSWHHEDMVFAAKLLYGIASPLKVKVKPLER